MKPSDFILNSDYLTIAQVSSTAPYTVFFPPNVFPTSGNRMQPFSVEQTIPSKAVPGAIDTISIAYEGITHHASQIYRPPDINVQGGNMFQDQYWVLNIYRRDANTLVAKCTYCPPTSAATPPATPSLTFTVSASSFKPPNVL